MKKLRVSVAAVAAMCVMGAAASSASAAITVSGAGGMPWNATVTLPVGSGGAADALRYGVNGSTFPCGSGMSTVITATGAISVSSFSPCPSLTFHPPFSGQIYGSPGDYRMMIPLTVTYSPGWAICEYSGTLRVNIASGSNVIGAISGTLTHPVTPNCGALVSNLVFSGNSGTGRIGPTAKIITGTL
jgi:hypothetical protein